jgi:AraC-like DNA-binding protein/mannose-6-phosphate isomerase-like protein (cupin superfamily)
LLNTDIISLYTGLDLTIKYVEENFASNWLVLRKPDKIQIADNNRVPRKTIFYPEGNTTPDNCVVSLEGNNLPGNSVVYPEDNIQNDCVYYKGEILKHAFKSESHDFVEICLCFDGRFAMKLDDSYHKLKKGDVCLIPPGTYHNEMIIGDCDYLTIWMTMDMNMTMLHLSGNKSDTGFYTLEGYTWYSSFDYNILLNNIKHELGADFTYTYSMQKAYIFQILINTLRKISDQKDPSEENRVWKEWLVSRIQEYVAQNLPNMIRLSDISKNVCISTNYLNTIFKSITGKTVIKYVEEYKINKARDLLKNTKESVGTIASNLGFYDQYHFSKIFKKGTGQTPTMFRKNNA